jgi:hypothetical protein
LTCPHKSTRVKHGSKTMLGMWQEIQSVIKTSEVSKV